MEAKAERASKSSQSFGGKGPRYNVNPKQVRIVCCSVT